MKENNKQHIVPPAFAVRMLLGFLKEELAEEVLGDLDEQFYTTLEEHSAAKAKRNYWYQVLQYLRPFALKTTRFKYSKFIPMKIHFKFTVRILKKNTLITFASLASIVLGVLSAFLIYLWVDNELSADQFHANYDRLYIPVVQQSPIDKAEPVHTSMYFKTDYGMYSEIDQLLQATYIMPDRIKFSYDHNEYRGGALVTDSTFFDFFDFKLLVGDEKNILANPANMILTAPFVQKVFGDADPVGEMLDFGTFGTFQVAGVLERIPSNSSIQFDFILPMHANEFWEVSGMEFLLTNAAFNWSDFNEKIRESGRKHSQFKESIVSVVPFREAYFGLDFDEDLLANRGDMADIQTMALVALIILITSMLNFANMQSTLFYTQTRTQNIKRVHGARYLDVLLELFVARLIYAVMSILLVTVLFTLVKPSYLNFIGLTIDKTWAEILWLIALSCFSFVMITAVISVFQYAKLSHVRALVAGINKGKNDYTGKVLTTIQYVFAIVLIIAAGVIFKQFRYMQDKDLGFEADNLVSVKFFDRVPYTGDFEIFKERSQAQREDYKYVKNELAKIPGISQVSQGEVPLSRSISGMAWKLANSDFEYSDVKLLTADPTYLQTLGLKMLKGRFFLDSLDKSRQQKVVINKTAMELWGIDDLDGVKIASSAWGGEKDPFQVIGVVDDFNFEHLSRKVAPLVIVYHEDPEKDFTMKISDQQFQPTLEAVRTVFQEIYPDRRLTYSVLEDELKAQYEYEKKLSETVTLFTIVALILSSLGLFTFALYDTQKRIKEIGIRKVMGASSQQIVSMLSNNFLKWVLLAFIIAVPIAWYAMGEWLTNFAHQTALSWWIFAAAGLVAALLALVTVIGQSFTAANRNPVHALRHE